MKRFLCILLCLCILGQSAMAAGGEEALPFVDAQGHWAEDYIAVCYESGLMEGVSDAQFDTEGSLTVASAPQLRPDSMPASPAAPSPKRVSPGMQTMCATWKIWVWYS